MRTAFDSAFVQSLMSDYSPEPFAALTGDERCTALVYLLLDFALTTTEREQVRWRVQYLILMARLKGTGPNKQARALDALGRAHYGPRFDPEATFALAETVAGKAGPKISSSARLLMEVLTDDEKEQFVSHLIPFLKSHNGKTLPGILGSVSKPVTA